MVVPVRAAGPGLTHVRTQAELAGFCCGDGVAERGPQGTAPSAHGGQPELGGPGAWGWGCLEATTRLGIELFTFFVAGVRDKDIFVGKSKIVGLGV